ncbi:MAG: TIM barrel protein [Acetobacteraceae bacterium]|nr:TIM barrel protein [Acetobacteraceae bacterium]
MEESPRFAVNHIAAPRQSFAGLARLARSLGMTEVEIRNDLPGVAIADGTPAEQVVAQASAAEVSILSINALQRFNAWDDRRAQEAAQLAAYAAGCGAAAVVLCPVNGFENWPEGWRSDVRRQDDLRLALRELAPILSSHGVTGLIEPLGFEVSSLRFKRDAIEAIDATASAGATFGVLHDTFHHFIAEEADIFPERTGLVHISGVEDRSLSRGGMLDGHRVLVGTGDVMGNVEQIRLLSQSGYAGPFSFEPFADSVHAISDLAPALRESMAAIRASLVRQNGAATEPEVVRG